MLMDKIAERREVTRYDLYEECPDYENLLELIFDHDSVITWW